MLNYSETRAIKLSTVPEVCKDLLRSLVRKYRVYSIPSKDSNRTPTKDSNLIVAAWPTFSRHVQANWLCLLADHWLQTQARWSVPNCVWCYTYTEIPKRYPDLIIVGTELRFTPWASCRLRIITRNPSDNINVTRVWSDPSDERVTNTRSMS